MTELSLDDQQRDPLAGHLDRVRVPQLVRREPAPDSGCLGGGAELAADSGWRARSTACRAAQHAEQRSDGQMGAELELGRGAPMPSGPCRPRDACRPSRA
jgi:hypothetical protein